MFQTSTMGDAYFFFFLAAPASSSCIPSLSWIRLNSCCSSSNSLSESSSRLTNFVRAPLMSACRFVYLKHYIAATEGSFLIVKGKLMVPNPVQ